jgi:hypothetical protein
MSQRRPAGDNGHFVKRLRFFRVVSDKGVTTLVERSQSVRFLVGDPAFSLGTFSEQEKKTRIYSSDQRMDTMLMGSNFKIFN